MLLYFVLNYDVPSEGHVMVFLVIMLYCFKSISVGLSLLLISLLSRQLRSLFNTISWLLGPNPLCALGPIFPSHHRGVYAMDSPIHVTWMDNMEQNGKTKTKRTSEIAMEKNGSILPYTPHHNGWKLIPFF